MKIGNAAEKMANASPGSIYNQSFVVALLPLLLPRFCELRRTVFVMPCAKLCKSISISLVAY